MLSRVVLAMLLTGAAPPPVLFELALPEGKGARQQVPADQTYKAGSFGFEPCPTKDAFLFSAAVPEGTYRVTVRLGDADEAGLTTVRAETRHLHLAALATRPGEFAERQFLVNVRGPALPPLPRNAPGESAVRIQGSDRAGRSWDEKLTLEFFGNPKVQSIRIEPAEAPVLHLLGDSTVADQRDDPAASWGQMLPAMVEGVAVANHAKNGATMKSFITSMRFDKVLSMLKPGDWMFIQFGHNDQKSEWPQTYVAADSTYRAYLKTFIAEARRRGANPVLVTSPERRNFDAAGRITPTLSEYAQAVREVALEEAVPLVDLNAASTRIYEQLGPERSPGAFAEEGRDRTHHNIYGAGLLAAALADAVRAGIPALAPSMPASRWPAHETSSTAPPHVAPVARRTGSSCSQAGAE